MSFQYFFLLAGEMTKKKKWGIISKGEGEDPQETVSVIWQMWKKYTSSVLVSGPESMLL